MTSPPSWPGVNAQPDMGGWARLKGLGTSTDAVGSWWCMCASWAEMICKVTPSLRGEGMRGEGGGGGERHVIERGRGERHVIERGRGERHVIERGREGKACH